MANICLYKIKVKGTKKACYALVNMMPLYSYEKIYISAEGTDEDFTLVFSGDCKWGINYRTVPMENPMPLTEEEIGKIEDGQYWGVKLRDKSILLHCEIFCNSKDIDDVSYSVYEHYDKGKVINDECPKELHIKRGRDYDNGEDIMLTLEIPPVDIQKTCKVKFESGSYWYAGDYQIGDLVYVDGAKKNSLGKVVETKEQTAGGFHSVLNCVGHIGEFISEDIENIWNSYKPKERKEYLAKLSFPDKTTKQKFLSAIEWQWTVFAQKQNDWNAFLQMLRNGMLSINES